MEEFKPGDECYHKATSKKCVVIKVYGDGMVKVRTENDEERDYNPVELRKVESGIVNRNEYEVKRPMSSIIDKKF